MSYNIVNSLIESILSYGIETYYVNIKHNNTFSTLYSHCSALFVLVIKQGKDIAQVGSTGSHFFRLFRME